MDLDLALRPVSILSERLGGLARDAVALAPNMIAAVMVLLLTALLSWAVAAALGRAFRGARARAALIEAVLILARIATWAIGLLVAATVLFPTLTPANALAGLGLGSIAIGLAFRDIFENFLAGFMILLRKPMRIGDDVICEGVFGRIERITLRDTHLRKRSGELMVLPNSHLFKNPLEILTDRPLRRIEVIAGVAYGEDVARSREVILSAVEGCATVAPERIDVFACGFGASSIDFLVRWWAGSAPIDEHRSRDEVVTAIKAALDAAGIEIPFPHRTLTFKGPGPRVEIGPAGAGEAAE